MYRTSVCFNLVSSPERKDRVALMYDPAAFPERPGSLLKFLQGLDKGWNVSLFNYRNNGGDTASILVGLQVEPQYYTEFDQFLVNTGYSFQEQTDNAAYRHFLREHQ